MAEIHEDLLDSLNNLVWQVLNIQDQVVRSLLGRDVHRNDPEADAVVLQPPATRAKAAAQPIATPPPAPAPASTKPGKRNGWDARRASRREAQELLVELLGPQGNMTCKEIDDLMGSNGCASAWRSGKWAPNPDRMEKLRGLHRERCGGGEE